MEGAWKSVEMEQSVKKDNQKVLELLSLYLNLCPDFIDGKMVKELTEGCGVSAEYAYAVLLAGACGLNMADNPHDRKLFERYFLPSVQRLDAAEWRADPYYRNIRMPELKQGRWELKYQTLKPYESTVIDDFRYTEDGRVLPPIGFFEEEFSYPVALENGREWMPVTPNEINSMRRDIEDAHGKVLTYGLGLGYYVYMTSVKENVTSVTVVECNADAIALFREHILPQFPNRDKVRIVEGDAFAYAEQQMAGEGYDFVYADTWHDPSDGVEMYRRFKATEPLSPGTEFRYWLEETMKYYL